MNLLQKSQTSSPDSVVTSKVPRQTKSLYLKNIAEQEIDNYGQFANDQEPFDERFV